MKRYFQVFTFTNPGLESLLHQELNRLLVGHTIESVPKQGCLIPSLSEDKLWSLCTSTRIATGIRIRLGPPQQTLKFNVFDRYVRTLPWDLLLPLTTKGFPHKVQATCHESKLFHSDALSERLLDYLQKKRYFPSDQRGSDSSDQNPFTVHVRVVNDMTQVSADVSGDIVSKRGYRKAVTEAPMRENLAAACLDAINYSGFVHSFRVALHFYN
jgi:putative N6-adenine-specific DNA methylase